MRGPDTGAARDAVLSDAPNGNFNWVMVGGAAGTVIYNTTGGNTYTITSAPVGVWIPLGNATNIRTASTATNLIVS